VAQYKRTDRVSDVLQREIADLIQHHVKDPRLVSMITVSAVEISRDLSYAKIYVTQLDNDPQSIKQNLKILNHAAGYLRAELGHRIKLRITPQLKFIYDESISHGAYLSGLINSAAAGDEETPPSNE
jgi:ribosome-binding factor A